MYMYRDVQHTNKNGFGSDHKLNMYMVHDNIDDDDDDDAHRRNSYNTSTSISLPSSFVSSSRRSNHHNKIKVDSSTMIVKEDASASHNSLFDGISYSQRQQKVNHHSGSTLLLNDIDEEQSLEIDDFGRIVRSVGNRAAAAAATTTTTTRHASPRTLRSDFSAWEREQLLRQQYNSSNNMRVGSLDMRDNYQHVDDRYSSPRRDGGVRRSRDPSVVESIRNYSSPRPLAVAEAPTDPEHTPENSYQSYYDLDHNKDYYDGSTISGSETYTGTLSASTITFDNHSNTSSIDPRRGVVIPHQVNIPSNKQKGTKIIISNIPKNGNMEIIRESVEDKSYQEPMRRERNVPYSREEGEKESSSKNYSHSTNEWERSRLFADASPRQTLPTHKNLETRMTGGKADPPNEEEEENASTDQVEEDVIYKPRPPLRKPHEAKSRETMVGRGKSTSRSVKSKSTTSRSKNDVQSRATSRSRSTGKSGNGTVGDGKLSLSNRSSSRKNDTEERSSRSRWNDAQSRSTFRRGQTLGRRSSSSSSSRHSIIEDRLCRLSEVQRRESYSRDRDLVKDRSSRSNGGQSRSSRSSRSAGRVSSSSSSNRKHGRNTKPRSSSPESEWGSMGGDNYDDENEAERRRGRQRQVSRRRLEYTDRYGEDYEDNIITSPRRSNSRRRGEDASSYHSGGGGGGVSVRSYNSSQSSVRRDLDDEGYCLHHPDIQLMKLRRDDTWRVLRKRCPECLKDTYDYDRRQGHVDRARSRSNSGSASGNPTPLDSDSVDISSSPSLEPFNGIGLKFQTPEEREAEEATNRLKRRLAARAYHFPGNSWCQDWMQYISNTHTVLGLFFHHPLHPMGFQERLVILFGSIAIGLTISNFTYMYFIRNGYSVKEEVLTFELKGVPEIGITKLMLVLWTLGSFLHTVFDLLLWHLKACTICRYRGRIDDRLMKWGRVVGLFIVMVTIGAGGYAVLLRASIEYEGEGSVADQVEESILSNELYEIQYDDKRSFGFLFGYLIEFLLALFVYYPLAITVLFSGVLGCSGRVPILGGRPREMKKEGRYELSKRRPRILNAGKAAEENHIV